MGLHEFLAGSLMSLVPVFDRKPETFWIAVKGGTNFPTGMYLSIGIAVLLISCGAHVVSAHEPLFMMSHEAPGKGASDWHFAIHGDRAEAERETGFELEYTRGITRNFAVKFGLPLIRQETRAGGRVDGSTGLGDPSVRVKWRFWDRDLLGAKYAVAAMVESTVPTGDGGGRLGHDRPSILSGLSHGRESLEWYYFVDIRYLYNVADNGTKQGDRLFLDFAPGWRPYLGGMEQTDIVLFLEFNYEHVFSSQVLGVDDPASGADYFFIAPEILLSPNNRLMFKSGFQIPLVQVLNNSEMAIDTRFVIEAELRF